MQSAGQDPRRQFRLIVVPAHNPDIAQALDDLANLLELEEANPLCLSKTLLAAEWAEFLRCMTRRHAFCA